MIVQWKQRGRFEAGLLVNKEELELQWKWRGLFGLACRKDVDWCSRILSHTLIVPVETGIDS